MFFINILKILNRNIKNNKKFIKKIKIKIISKNIIIIIIKKIKKINKKVIN